MKLKGSIIEVKSRVDTSGETIQRVSLEVHGDSFPALHLLMKMPISITIEKLKEDFEE